MDSWLSLRALGRSKTQETHPGFELGSPISFSLMITVAISTPPLQKSNLIKFCANYLFNEYLLEVKDYYNLLLETILLLANYLC